MLFDGTRATVARWAHSGSGRFELRDDCTLQTVGGLGLLWYDDERFDSPLTLKVEWLVEGDSNSGVFMGFPPVGDDPFVAVERGYEIQIDPTDEPAATTGAIYGFQAARPGAARRGTPPGGRVEHVRDYGRRAPRRRPAERRGRQPLPVDDCRAAEPRPRLRRPPEPRRRRPCSLSECPGQGVGRRAAAVLRGGAAHSKRHVLRRTARRLPLDANCALRRRRARGDRRSAAPRAHGRRLPRPAQRRRRQPRAPACACGTWTIETTVRMPLRSGSQQAGLLVYRDDGTYVKLVASAPGARVRFQPVGATTGSSSGMLQRRWSLDRGATPTGCASRGRAHGSRASGA